MLLMCHVTMQPEDRDESLGRFMENGVPEVRGIKLKGVWISLMQQESFILVESDKPEAIAALFEPWTNLNVHDLVPVMDFDQPKKFLGSKG